MHILNQGETKSVPKGILKKLWVRILTSSANPTPSFVSDVLKLVGGTVFAQALAVLATPILTRLYGPEAFGTAALFAAITGIISVVACLRYELSIMLPKKDEDAANILILSLILTGLTSAMTMPILWLGGGFIVRLLNAPELGQYLWMVPPAVFLSGAFIALSYWNARLKCFGNLSLAKMTASLSTSGIRIGAGFMGYANAGSLIEATIVGSAASTFMLGWRVWRNESVLLFKSVNPKNMVKGLKKYKKLPIFDCWTAIIGAFSWQMPSLLLSIFFSPTVVGYYALSMAMLQLPMSLIGSSIAQVFFQRAAEAKSNGNLSILIEKLAISLIGLGIFPMMLLAIIGKDIFIFIFGGAWAEAGVYVQILSIFLFFQFISSPISTLFSVLEKQRASLIYTIITTPLLASSLIIGGMFLDARTTVLLFSLVQTMIYAFGFSWIVSCAGVSLIIIIKKATTYLVYSFTCAIILILMSLFFDRKLIVIFGIIICIIYYIIISKRITIDLSKII